MEKKTLIKRISQGLGILTLSLFVGSGICYSKEKPKGYKIPDLSRAIPMNEPPIGKPVYEDLTDKIEGPETKVEGYQRGSMRSISKENPLITISKLSVNGKVFFYGISNWSTGDIML